MATVAELNVKIGADIASFQAGMRKMESALKETGTRLRSAGKTLSLAVTVPILGVGAAAIKAASDAEEMQSKFNTVFKTMGGSVSRELDAFARQVGRSRYELRGMAGNMGDLFKPLGFTEEAAAALSVQVTKLAVDLGSFNNMPMDEALARLRGTLVGSHENALAFNVVINEATLRQELMRMGADKLTGSQLNQAKAQARLNLLIAGTTDAHGDATRTAGSFANQMQALRASLKDLGITLGNIIMPYAREFVGRLNAWATGLAGASKETQTMLVRFAAFAALLGPALIVVGGLATAFSAVFRSISLIISVTNPYVAAAAAIAAVAVFLVKNWTAVADVIDRNVTAFRNLGTELGRIAKDKFSAFSDALADWLFGADDAFEEFKNSFDGTKDDIVSAVAQLIIDLNDPSKIGEIDLDILNLEKLIDAALPEDLKAALEELGRISKSALNGESGDTVKTATDAAKSHIESVKTAAVDLRTVDPDIRLMLGKFTGENNSIVAASKDASQKIGEVETAISDLDKMEYENGSLKGIITLIGGSKEEGGLTGIADAAKTSIDELFGSVPTELDMPEWDLAPSPEDQTSALGWWNNFKLSLTDTKNEAYNVQRYLYDAKAALDVLFGSKLGAWADKLTSAATDAVTLLRGFESIAALFEKETWTNITGILATVFDWVSKIAGKVWDWFAGQSAVNTATATGDAIGAVTGAGAGATGAGGGGLFAAGGALAGITGGAALIGGFAGLMNWLGGYTGSTLAGNGFDITQYGGGNLAGLLGGNINTGGLNFGDPWLGGGGRMAGGQNVNVYLDGNVIATASLPYIANELNLRGTNF